MVGAQETTGRTITCPRCGHLQNDAIECSRCGIVFIKHYEFIQRKSSTSPGGLAVQTNHAMDLKRLGILLVLLGILGFALCDLWASRDVCHPPGVLVHSPPIQTVIGNPHPWKRGGRQIYPLARFQLKARVLSKERYRFDVQSNLSPVDLALGWGPMSDQDVVDQLEIIQSDRWYLISPKHSRAPIPWPLVFANSSNMHMIPANDDIERRLVRLRPGEIIELTGFLVGVRERGKWVWVSSLSRTDTGDGACEIVWVDGLSIL